MRPIVILNLKAYKAGFYELEDIISTVRDVAKQFPRIDFVVAPNLLVAARALELAKPYVKIFLQHVDPVPYGAFTGYIPLAAVKDMGFDGAIVNHSEHKVSYEHIKKVIELGKKLGVPLVVCAGDVEDTAKISKLAPSYVAFEPPELIGTGISVSKAKPDELKHSIRVINEYSNGKAIPICGAGITTGRDVKAAFELGAKGVLVASAFVKAGDRRKLLIEFAEVIEATV